MENIQKKIIIGITSSASTVLLTGQLKYLKEQGFITYLMAPKDKRTIDFCQEEGCVLLAVNFSRNISIVKDIYSLILVIYYILKVRPDIVNFGTPKAGLLGMIGSSILIVPYRIYTCRGLRFEHESGFVRNVSMISEKIAGGLAHNIIAISPSLKSRSLEFDLFDKSKVVVFGGGSSNGIDLERFNLRNVDEKEKSKLIEEFKIDGKFVFGFVGRLVDRKGIAELFLAFDKIYTENNNVRLLFVGRIEEEQILNVELLSKIKSHPGVILAGLQLNVPLYLSLIDVLVLPAWWEGFGNVLIQAAAMGIPVISTRVTGCMDAVSDGYNGILVEPQNYSLLSSEMSNLMNNREQMEMLGRNGLIWATRFDSKLIWSQMNKLYSQNERI